MISRTNFPNFVRPNNYGNEKKHLLPSPGSRAQVAPEKVRKRGEKQRKRKEKEPRKRWQKTWEEKPMPRKIWDSCSTAPA